MPRFPVRRRTLAWLALAYFASLGGLAWLIPHRPRLGFSAGEYPHLIGFSPDGSHVATASADLWRANVDTDKITISTWDIRGRLPLASATKVSERPAGWLSHLAWSWIEDPGRRWLFWQCVGADDVPVRLRELLSVSDMEAGDLDPTEDTPRIRVSEGGTYVAVRNDDGAYRVFERSTGRVCATTGPTDNPPAFGPKCDVVTSVEKSAAANGVTVRRWDLKTGLESRPSRFDVFPGAGIRLSMGGRWLLAYLDQASSGLCSCFRRGDLHDPLTGRRVVSVAYSQEWRLIDPGNCLLTIDGRGKDLPEARFFDFDRGETITCVLPGAVRPQPAAALPDGSAVVIMDGRGPDLLPWSSPAALKLGYSWLTKVRSTDNATLYICDVATGEILTRLPALALNPTALTGEGTAAFSDDGQQLAVVGAGGEVRVYDWPLRRPWLFIASIAAVPTLFGGMVVIGFRRMCRRGRSDPRVA
jgi:WD40 repeat protein